MKGKKIIGLVTLSAMMTLMFSGCGKDSEKVTYEEGSPVPIEIFVRGWSNAPQPENDPMKEWFKENMNVDITLVSAEDFGNQLALRVSSGNIPDIVSFWSNPNDEAIMKQLYDSGVFVEDWNEYLPQMPNVAAGICDEAVEKFTTEDGKLMYINQIGSSDQTWGLQVRKDWLENLNLDVPTTPEELLEVARAFTYDDPDGNGKDDTYAFDSTGGSSKDLGLISYLRQMWGQNSFYVDKNGEPTHMVVNGKNKEFLDFMRTVVDEKLIDPTWATAKWQERTLLMQGKIGFEFYPADSIIDETQSAQTDPSIDCSTWWDVIPMPKGDEEGGKVFINSEMGTGSITVSADAQKDEVKFNAILKLLNDIWYPSEDYFKVVRQYEIDPNVTKVSLDNGYTYYGKQDPSLKGMIDSQPALPDWYAWFYCWNDKTVAGTSPEPSNLDLAKMELKQKTIEQEHYPYLAYDPDDKLLNEINTLQNVFEINYILGKTNDYEGFVKEWLDKGGQQILDDMKIYLDNKE